MGDNTGFIERDNPMPQAENIPTPPFAEFPSSAILQSLHRIEARLSRLEIALLAKASRS